MGGLSLSVLLLRSRCLPSGESIRPQLAGRTVPAAIAPVVPVRAVAEIAGVGVLDQQIDESIAADLAVYTPLARRRMVAAVVASSLVGLVVDSIVFLWLAFGSLQFLPGQIVGKAWMVLLSIPFVLYLRRRDERLGLNPA